MATKQVESQEVMAVGDLPKRAQALIEHLGIRLSDPTEVQWRIAEQLALATTAEELFDGGKAEGLREHMGEKFRIRDVDFLPSTQQGSAFFAVISGYKPDGEAVVFTTGATSVVIQLARGMQIGAFEDRYVKAEYSTEAPSADGNRPYRLVQA